MPLIHKDNDPLFPEGHEAPYFKLFTSWTINGRKITLLLDLIGKDYIYRTFKDFKTETKEDWFVAINPNKQIPAIQDVNEAGEAFSLAESGAILQYIAYKYDTEHKASYPLDSPLHWEETQVLFYHASNLGPKQTKFNIARNTKDTEALPGLIKDLAAAYEFFEGKLSTNKAGFLVGDHISLADIIALPHAKAAAEALEFDSKFPNLTKWIKKLEAIPEVQKAFGRD
ncbi:hypothetical protein WICPIJ_006949 [Wickerhamomyces pijperi]|uniref:Glutathione transferase n=1 Tax=Wickerhamomyces pijperi TaxID=599730 RepID=A0A9P8Q2R7_WICPI|nr:hypothetical protein WICPIJ_006949 [Wickerhamomyces pijperi]